MTRRSPRFPRCAVESARPRARRLGGAAGSGARWLAFEIAPVPVHLFPTTTLCINVSGAFLLGYLVERFASTWWTRPLLGIGLLGGFTTMSTFAVDVAQLARSDRWTTAAAYVTATTVLGIGAAVCGLLVGGWRPRAVPSSEEES